MMGLSNQTIRNARDLATELKTSSKDNMDMITLILGNDAVKFRNYLNMTEGGRDFLKKYENLLQGVGEYYELTHQVANLVNEYLDEQERTNK